MKYLFKSVVVLLIGATSHFTNAQTTEHYADSLRGIAARTPADTNTVNSLVALQRFYFERGLYDSTLKYARLSLPIATRLDSKKSMARAHYNLGMTYTNLTQYDSARVHLDEIERYFPYLEDSILIISTYNANALLSNYQSDYASAVAYLTKAAELVDKTTTPSLKKLLPQTYGNLAYNLLSEKQFEKAIEYAKKALTLRDYPNEPRYRVILHLDIAEGNMQLKRLAEAKIYLDSAALLNVPLKNIVMTSLVANNEGNYYNLMGDSSKALSAYLKAYQLCDSIGNDFLKGEAGVNISELYFQTGKPNDAEKFAKESIVTTKNLKQYAAAAKAYGVLMKVSSHKGDYKGALVFADLNKVYADSALNDESHKTILALESRYQHQKKEKEIATLTIANTERELAVVKRNRWLIAGGIFAAAALTVLGLSYKNSRQKRIIAERENTLQQEQIRFLERQQQVVSLQSMINGQETERTRIARDLHDGLGGLFSTVKMYFSTLQHDSPILEKNELFLKSYNLVDTASVEVRRIAHNMMPEVLMKLGLVNALKDLCDNISAGKLLNVTLEVHGMNGRLNATTEIMLFRIVQELLNNIIKHANASEAIIQFIRDTGRLSVIVEDNGRGFNTDQADEQKKAGIATIRSRVDYLNGKMSIDSQQNVGTTIMMDFLINEV